jgi:predicted alpha/beta hydrolase family esterase
MLFSHSPAQTHISPPPLYMLARETVSYAYMRVMADYGAAAKIDTQGHGEKILIIPGFMASDKATDRLRRSLNEKGFDAHGWGLGRNKYISAQMLDQLEQQVEAISGGDKVTLIGWSLGGLIAREFAKKAPHRINRVITLGSPFSGGQKANNAWRLYEFIAGHKVENPPIPVILHEKPPVHTVAIWSAQDGVVAAGSACGLPMESDRQIELDCTHMSFVVRPAAINAIARAIVD